MAKDSVRSSEAGFWRQRAIWLVGVWYLGLLSGLRFNPEAAIGIVVLAPISAIFVALGFFLLPVGLAQNLGISVPAPLAKPLYLATLGFIVFLHVVVYRQQRWRDLIGLSLIVVVSAYGTCDVLGRFR